MSRTFDPSSIQWHTLPEEYQAEMKAYVMDGERPSPFISRVLDGDLFGAFELSGAVPECPGPHMLRVVGWVNGQLPEDSFGNIYTVEKWITQRGMKGKDAKRREQARKAQEYKDRMLDAGGAQNVSAFMKVRALVTGRAA